MITVTSDEFQQLINEAMDTLPSEHTAGIQNVAILWQDEPTTEQLKHAKAGRGYTLLGLYEGVPLPERQGTTSLYPDRITLFKLPLEARCNTRIELKEQIRHTLWHEIAHYYGLDHDAIRAKE